MSRLTDTLRCWLAQPRWVFVDPTGGDPFMGGPVVIKVCAACNVQEGHH